MLTKSTTKAPDRDLNASNNNAVNRASNDRDLQTLRDLKDVVHVQHLEESSHEAFLLVFLREKFNLHLLSMS